MLGARVTLGRPLSGSSRAVCPDACLNLAVAWTPRPQTPHVPSIPCATTRAQKDFHLDKSCPSPTAPADTCTQEQHSAQECLLSPLDSDRVCSALLSWVWLSQKSLLTTVGMPAGQGLEIFPHGDSDHRPCRRSPPWSSSCCCILTVYHQIHHRAYGHI